MNIQFRKIHLLSLPELNAHALIKLAGDDKNNGLKTPSLSAGVPKSKIISRSNLDEIIQDIESHQTENITALEWIHCIYNKDKWDTKNPDKSISTSQAIWKAAEQNSWLKQRLFWNLVLNYNGKRVLASSLVNSYSSFLPQNRLDKETLEIIQILTISEPANKLVTQCREKRLTPYQLFQKYQLPTKSSILERTLDEIIIAFAWNATPNQQVQWLSDQRQDRWLLKCLEEMRTIQQIQAVELLLTQVNSKIGSESPELMNWLRQHYGSAVANSRWNELSPEAKAEMQKWLGAVSYQDFQRLVSLILDRVHLAEHEYNRLKSRSGFWSNYSDRFERIRILLPQSSVSILGSYLNHQDVEILQEDGSDPTEVCIFDFGAWFVVEFFRGNGSETRLFARDAKTEQQLFNSQLSIKKLRCLGLNKPIHDHVFCWQYYCERWLKQHNIPPNQGTTHFKGIPHQYSRYSQQTGLSEPSFDNQRKRDRSLEYWKRDIAKLEMGITEYC